MRFNNTRRNDQAANEERGSAPNPAGGGAFAAPTPDPTRAGASPLDPKEGSGPAAENSPLGSDTRQRGSAETGPVGKEEGSAGQSVAGAEGTANSTSQPATAAGSGASTMSVGLGSRASGPGLVVVALNHPNGIKFALKDGRQVVINGNATHLRGRETGVLPVGRYGLTLVKAEEWEEILRTYGQMDVFKKNLIFSRPRKAEAEDQAEEMKETRHGREPVDPTTTATTEGHRE